MRIPELLAPAGNMDSLRAALHFGADAVYGGMKQYGAAEIGVDAAIAADPGAILTLRKKVPQLPVHVSTQANTVNAPAAELYRDLGCERVILAREMSLDRIRALHKKLGDSIQIETFVHGWPIPDGACCPPT